MIVSTFRAWIACAAIFGSLFVAAPFAAHASYVNLGPAGDFNVFVFGDNTQHDSDVEGRLAVGGNIDFTKNGSGFTVASKSSTNTDNLIVGGNYKNTWHSLQGGALVNGNVDWMGPTLNGRLNVNGNANFGNLGGTVVGPINVVGTYTAPNYFPPNANPPSVTSLPFDFAAVESYLLAQSNSLANLAPNGTTSINFGQITLNAAGPPSSLYVFDVSGADLAVGNAFTVNAPAGSTVVVNIDGSSTSFKNMGITLNGVDRQHVLYNFHEANSLSVTSIGIQGTILAPKADVNFTNGAIDGTLIAKNLTGNGESHLYLFQGSLPVVPEPATWILATLAALAIWKFRRAG